MVIEQDMLHCYIVSVVVLFVKWDELMKLALVKLLQKCALLTATVRNPIVFLPTSLQRLKNIYLLISKL